MRAQHYCNQPVLSVESTGCKLLPSAHACACPPCLRRMCPQGTGPQQHRPDRGAGRRRGAAASGTPANRSPHRHQVSRAQVGGRRRGGAHPPHCRPLCTSCWGRPGGGAGAGGHPCWHCRPPLQPPGPVSLPYRREVVSSGGRAWLPDFVMRSITLVSPCLGALEALNCSVGGCAPGDVAPTDRLALFSVRRLPAATDRLSIQCVTYPGSLAFLTALHQRCSAPHPQAGQGACTSAAQLSAQPHGGIWTGAVG